MLVPLGRWSLLTSRLCCGPFRVFLLLGGVPLHLLLAFVLISLCLVMWVCSLWLISHLFSLCCERRNLQARRRSKHSPCFCASTREENVVEIYDVLTLLTGLFHKSESADLKSKWKLTRTYIYHLHHHHCIAQIACRKVLRWFFVIACLLCKERHFSTILKFLVI